MKYRPEVDGLRALAVIPVIFFHADFNLFAGGYIGVDIFFVISGFLITTIIIAELERDTFSIVNFYERRARRILPALFFVMLVCIPFAWVLLISPDMQSFSQSLVSVSVFASNVLFWITSGYFESASELKPLLHTWSLALEEQFYVIFPLLLMLLWKVRKTYVVMTLVVIALASFAAAQWGSTRHPDATFYLLHTRAWELLIGSFVAFYLYKKDKVVLPSAPSTPSRLLAEGASLSGLAMLLIAMFTFNAQTPFPSVYALLPVVGTALIILCASPATLVGRFLSHKWLVGIGLISYSAYLWHQPLFAFARHYQIEDTAVATYLLLSVLSLVLAYFSWKFIEAPFRNKKRFTRRHIFTLSFVGTVFFILVGLVGHFTEGKFFRQYDEVQVRLISTMDQRGHNASCWRALERGQFDSTACVLGDRTQPPSFALLGDSHAGAFAPSLDEFARVRQLAGLNYTYTSCAPIFGLTPLAASNRYQHCLAIRDHYEAMLDAGELPHNIIIGARWSIYLFSDPFDNQEGGREPHGHVMWTTSTDVYVDNDFRLQEAITDTIELFLARGHRVFILYPTPEMGWNVPARLKKLYGNNRNLGSFDASTAMDVYQNRNLIANRALNEVNDTPWLYRVKPADVLCREGRCLAHQDGIPYFYDRDHLSVEGAQQILENFVFPVLNKESPSTQ